MTPKGFEPSTPRFPYVFIETIIVSLSTELSFLKKVGNLRVWCSNQAELRSHFYVLACSELIDLSEFKPESARENFVFSLSYGAIF